MVIINGKILTMEEETIDCGYVRICEDKIAEIGTMEFYNNSPKVREKLDKIGVPKNHLVWGTAALGYASDDAKRNFEKNSNVVKWVF